MSGTTHSGKGILAISAWNTENLDQDVTSFDCDTNPELYQYFLRQEPIPVLLLIDKQAKWNQELENVYLVSCSHIDYTNYDHYEYELRPDDD
jgi:hypothetical protein